MEGEGHDPAACWSGVVRRPLLSRVSDQLPAQYLCKPLVRTDKNTLLTTLLLEKNYIGRNGRKDFENLVGLKSLSVLDLSGNHIDDPALVFEVLTELPALKVLYLKGNPVVSSRLSSVEQASVWVKSGAYACSRPSRKGEVRLPVSLWTRNIPVIMHRYEESLTIARRLS